MHLSPQLNILKRTLLGTTEDVDVDVGLLYIKGLVSPFHTCGPNILAFRNTKINYDQDPWGMQLFTMQVS